MDKDLLLKNMFMAVENTKSIRDNMDKGFDKLLEKLSRTTKVYNLLQG